MARSTNKKICMLGDFSVGKTSLVRRYVLSEFSPEYQSTLGVNVHKFSDDIMVAGSETRTFSMIIWDVEGGIQNDKLLESYILGSAGAIIVGDVTRSDTLVAMDTYAKKFQGLMPGRPLGFAYNKIDLLPEGKELDEAGLKQTYSAPVIRTSAATGEQVAKLFHALGAQIMMTGA